MPLSRFWENYVGFMLLSGSTGSGKLAWLNTGYGKHILVFGDVYDER